MTTNSAVPGPTSPPRRVDPVPAASGGAVAALAGAEA